MLSEKKISFRVSMLLTLLPLLREAIGDKDAKVLKGVLHKADIHLKEACGYIFGSSEATDGFWVRTEEIVDCGYLKKHQVGFVKVSCGSIYLVADINYNPLQHESTRSSYAAVMRKKVDLTEGKSTQDETIKAA